MSQPALTAIPQYIVSTSDYQQQARHHLDDNAWHYLVGGAGDEITANANESTFQQYLLNTKVLSDVRGGHTQLSLFGRHYQHPIFLAPVAYQTLFHPQGERATALAAHVMNTPFTVSSLSSTLLEDIRSEDEQALWFQLYFQAERQQTLSLVERAELLGYQVLVVTVDAPLAGIRNREQRMGFQLPSHVHAVNLTRSSGEASHHQSDSFVFNQLMANAPTWDDIEWLLSVSRLPMVIKGILSPEDAEKAISVGVAGIVVSNHGGRILDGVLPSLAALPDIIKTVNGRVPVLLDGGMRRGGDVFKALALGASAVFIGRPYIYALASAGALGVAHLIRTLCEELEVTMALCGCRDLSAITRACVLKKGEADV
ncbi:MAG: alpha-hydroxy acid oxidase [Agitococcus sp.]|nr:alpha-hydroxy acid oxidase [Agitococcus sp.]